MKALRPVSTMRESRDGADSVLDKIAAWCDEHGWDDLDSPAFNAWLEAEGIPRDSLMIAKCKIPEGA